MKVVLSKDVMGAIRCEIGKRKEVLLFMSDDPEFAETIFSGMSQRCAELDAKNATFPVTINGGVVEVPVGDWLVKCANGTLFSQTDKQMKLLFSEVEIVG